MSVIGGPPQDLKFRGEASRLVIGDRNTIREFVTIHTGTEQGGGITAIGNDCLLMAYVHVAHDCILRDRVILSNSTELAGHVLLEEGVVVGGKTGVHHFVTVGRGAFVGGMSAVRQDIPPFMVAEGMPARVRGINSIGLRRADHTRKAIDAVKEAFRVLYRSDLNFRESSVRLDELATEYEEVRSILDAMRGMEDGRGGRARESTRIYPALS
jgi:UDP-N-acetylglucosamine acyltransferase